MNKAKPSQNKKNKSDFFDRVYKIVKRIPYGKVTSYGAIAEACGVKSAARTVGWAMNGAKDSNLPCHRVVNRYGALTGKFHFGSESLMKDLLISEGIEFDEDDCVIMGKYFWDPNKKSNKKKTRSR